MKISSKIVFLSLLILISGFACRSDYAKKRENIAVSEILSDLPADGDFARAFSPVPFNFPVDLGMHVAFRNEWWYFTGNLTTATGREFGYQLTFFRTGLSRDSLSVKSEWRSNQIFMAHFAVTDISKGKFYFSQRFSRAAIGLAGVEIEPFKIWLEDWRAVQMADSDFKLPILSLFAEEADFSISLQLKPIKPIVLNGENGLSQKGGEKGNASYYYSFTRLVTNGTVKIKNKEFPVTGFSWLDREWSTSALGKNQVGWDWFSLQFENGTEMMYYQIRRSDGSPAPQSQGMFIDKEGNYQKISVKDVKIQIKDYWKSPLGGNYPSGWKFVDKKLNLEIEIEPSLKNQEIDGFVRYWEGSVKVAGEMNGKKIRGRGYVEMTGYGSTKF